MRLPVKSPELLLKCEEYVETWESLIQTFYQRVISDDAVYTALCPDEEGKARFSMELGTVLLVTAVREWSRKKLREDIGKKVEDGVTRAVCASLFGAEGETLQTYLDFYELRRRMFQRLSPSETAKDPNDLHRQMIGFARFTAAQCSDREESQNADAIEKLSMYLIGVAEIFRRLTDNTTLDGNSLLGMKLRFIVKK